MFAFTTNMTSDMRVAITIAADVCGRGKVGTWAVNNKTGQGQTEIKETGI